MPVAAVAAAVAPSPASRAAAYYSAGVAANLCWGPGDANQNDGNEQQKQQLQQKQQQKLNAQIAAKLGLPATATASNSSNGGVKLVAVPWQPEPHPERVPHNYKHAPVSWLRLIPPAGLPSTSPHLRALAAAAAAADRAADPSLPHYTSISTGTTSTTGSSGAVSGKTVPTSATKMAGLQPTTATTATTGTTAAAAAASAAALTATAALSPASPLLALPTASPRRLDVDVSTATADSAVSATSAGHSSVGQVRQALSFRSVAMAVEE